MVNRRQPPPFPFVQMSADSLTSLTRAFPWEIEINNNHLTGRFNETPSAPPPSPISPPYTMISHQCHFNDNGFCIAVFNCNRRSSVYHLQDDMEMLDLNEIKVESDGYETDETEFSGED